MSNILTADDIGARHAYIAHARPDFRRGMAGIVNEGGPWKCQRCDGASLLSYRCSACGADLIDG